MEGCPSPRRLRHQPVGQDQRHLGRAVPAARTIPPQAIRRAKPVQRATVYASALGNYELYLNGRQVGDAYFTPGWTDYNTRVYYNTFDVTDYLKKGTNAIGGILADGWYSGHIGWMHIRDHYGPNPRFAAQLHIEFVDGRSKTIATDGTWKAATGPILEGDFLMGETYDARKEMPGWSTGQFDDGSWQHGQCRRDHHGQDRALSRRSRCGKYQEIRPREDDRAAEEVPYVYDMGTNFAGFVRLEGQQRQAGPEDRSAFRRAAESRRHDLHNQPARRRVIDTYICKGGKEVWQPRFTFHGFQYVEVTGYPGQPGLDAITGVELTSDTPVVGDFSCSDATANTLYHNIRQTQRANFIDIPTDCPQRDERLGWMGDAQIYVRTATYNTDVAAFFTKWLVDVQDAQLPNGGFSDVSPRKVAPGRRHRGLGRRRRHLPVDDLQGLRRHPHPGRALRGHAEVDRVLQRHVTLSGATIVGRPCCGRPKATATG